MTKQAKKVELNSHFDFFKPVVLLLGSNLGDRVAILEQARQKLEQKLGVAHAVSQVYQTAPWGKTDQPAFLNQALLFQTNRPPLQLLEAALSTEQELGRKRLEKWGARRIDIDLLAYGDYTFESERLKLPHPHLSERRFALLPMQEVYPDWTHPMTQQKISELVKNCPDQLPVELF